MQGRRLQQLVSYLLLYRDRLHRREALAAALWPESGALQARRNLRQSLWLLQRLPARNEAYFPQLLVTDNQWVRVNPVTVWLDSAALEATFDRFRDVCPELVTPDDAADIMSAVDLYKGDLLEGWDDRWCVQERDRLRSIYRALLDKLVAFCEVNMRIETGITYCERLLRLDPASERAHWRMMRLHRLAGDRTAALRQFERCREALQAELGVAPGRLTRRLCEEIRSG